MIVKSCQSWEPTSDRSQHNYYSRRDSFWEKSCFRREHHAATTMRVPSSHLVRLQVISYNQQPCFYSIGYAIAKNDSAALSESSIEKQSVIRGHATVSSSRMLHKNWSATVGHASSKSNVYDEPMPSQTRNRGWLLGLFSVQTWLQTADEFAVWARFQVSFPSCTMS